MAGVNVVIGVHGWSIHVAGAGVQPTFLCDVGELDIALSSVPGAPGQVRVKAMQNFTGDPLKGIIRGIMENIKNTKNHILHYMGVGRL